MQRVKYSEQMPGALQNPRVLIAWAAAALLLMWCVGLFGRGYWTPDEPREADIAWRMSWQSDKAVPLLAGEAFCEKPPFTYWLAAVPIKLMGMHAWIGATAQFAVCTDHGARRRIAGSAQRRSICRRGRCRGHQHISAFLPSCNLAGHRCTAARRRLGVAAWRLCGLLCPDESRTLARLSIDACRLGRRIPVQKRGGLDGAGDGHCDVEHLGEALARTASMGTVCRIADSSGD